MNILHILGNGFDLNLGLKTSYSDFYSYYQEIGNTDPVIIKLKEEIDLDSNNWSDLEIALGRYSIKWSKEDFEKVYEDLVDNLCNYLEKEIEFFNESNFDHDKMFRYLSFSEDYLDQKDMLDIKEFKKERNENEKIDVITLNYTNTLENILVRYKNGGYNISKERVVYYLGEIKHIHGYTDERVILGVNDITQISNIEFHHDLEIEDMFIKHDANSNQRHNIDTECYNLIGKADLIYIFGSSLGQTDKYIWKLLGERIKEGAKVVIFNSGRGINFRHGHHKIRNRKETVKKFMELSGTSEEFAKNIYVGIKTGMFNFK
ncbi:AbiH family protein [Myroides sp. N17-2]|uniref:AbiH family protein n=1 Tax=Myroides sp. N17-2 TaxID=2030799 RepID=UPI0013045B67|nr:AbiH family protein [Myroides sp. N17-2]